VLALDAARPSGDREETRRFSFEYRATVAIPEGAGRVRAWLPYPQSDAHQTILAAAVEAPGPTEIHRDARYGNAMLHLDLESPPAGELEVVMRFEVLRREWLSGALPRASATPTPAVARRWLESDRLVPLDGRVRRLAAEVTAGAGTPLAKARAIYDWVVATMRYDKSGSGWGNGDIYWACDTKRGNCTDFHALFIGLCRAAGIPAKFAIGFPLPPERGSGELAGYHCWAEFYLPGHGWVPVDTSEASKRPEKREYFFGAHDENRVQFSIGRDLVLAPPQSGEPLNYFVYPYVELDGRPHDGVERSLRFRDLDASGAASR
jgi:transglutaminase-like putative cysteine protease